MATWRLDEGRINIARKEGYTDGRIDGGYLTSSSVSIIAQRVKT